MAKRTFVTDSELANVAKKTREKAGKRKIDAARELGVSPAAIFNAEERPELPLHKLRIRMIGTYSKYEVGGPVYFLQRK